MPRLPRLKVQGLVDKWVNVNRECVVLNEQEEHQHQDDSVRSSAGSVRSAQGASAATVRRRSSAAASKEEAVALQQIQQTPSVGKDAAFPATSATGFSAVSTSLRVHGKSKLRHDKSKAEKKLLDGAATSTKIKNKPPKKSSRFRGRRRDRSDNGDNLDDSEHARDNCKGTGSPAASANGGGGSEDDEVTVTSVRTARTASSAYTASTYATQISSQVVFGPVVAASEEADDVSVAVSTASSHSKRRKAAWAAAQARAAQSVPPSVGFGAAGTGPAPATATPFPLFHPHCQPTPTPGTTPGVMEPSPGVIFSPMGDGAVPCFPGGQPFPAPIPQAASSVPGFVPGASSVPGVIAAPSAVTGLSPPSPPVMGLSTPPRPVAPVAALPPAHARQQQPPLPGMIVMEHNDWGKVNSTAPPEVVMPPPPPPQHQQTAPVAGAMALSPPPASITHVDHRRWGTLVTATHPTPVPAISAVPQQPRPAVAVPPPLAPYPPLPPHLKPKVIKPVVAVAHHPVATTAVPGGKSSQEVAMQALEQYRQRSTGVPGRPRVDELQATGIFREALPPSVVAHPPAERRAPLAAQEIDSDDETDCSVEIEARMRTGLALSSGREEPRKPNAVKSGGVPASVESSKEDVVESGGVSQTSAEARMMEAAVILSTQLRTRA